MCHTASRLASSTAYALVYSFGSNRNGMARGGLGSCAIQISKNMAVHDDLSCTHDYHQLRKVGGTRDVR